LDQLSFDEQLNDCSVGCWLNGTFRVDTDNPVFMLLTSEAPSNGKGWLALSDPQIIGQENDSWLIASLALGGILIAIPLLAWIIGSRRSKATLCI
jgi:hypothetical protein